MNKRLLRTSMLGMLTFGLLLGGGPVRADIVVYAHLGGRGPLAFRARRMTRIALALVFMALSLVGPAGRPDVARAAQFDQGLQDGWSFDNLGDTTNPHMLIHLLPVMQQAGAGWVRIHFRLGPCFSDWATTGCRTGIDGKTALDLYDEVVNAALSRNLRVLGLLTHESWHGTQPAWNENNVENGGTDGDNAFIQALTTNAAAPLAAHFKGRINTWELWTKPNAWTDNAGTVYSGGTFVYPSNYAQMLKQVGAAIKTVTDSSATFISGGLLGHDLGVKHQGLTGTYKLAGEAASRCPSVLPSGGEYLCATYDMGRTKAGWTPGRSPFDHVGQHLYIKQQGAVTEKDLTNYLADLRKVYTVYGGQASMQTHVTAFGWRTDAVNASIQARNLRVAYTTFQSLSPSRGGYVARAFWFRTRDEENPPYNPGYFDYYGLTDPSGGLKPAFTTYQRYAAY
jgi:hypothetical protein